MAAVNIDNMKRHLEAAGQHHLWTHYESLTDAGEREGFLKSLQDAGDFVLLTNIFKESMRVVDEGVAGAIEPPVDADLVSIDSLDGSMADIGYEKMAAGQVAVLILAGGSGTRLGQTFPKGMLVCPDLVQQKSLFQLHCEKIRRLEQLTAAKTGCTRTRGLIPVLYMTSEQTDEATRSFFAENDYFGLQKSQIHFFLQSSIPSMDMEGKVLIRSPTELCTFPGGNAGVYAGLAQSGVLAAIDKQGVKYVQVFTVDNILCKLGDPAFTGYACANNCDVVVKACPKARDHEAVGVFAKRGGKWGVVEYTEIGKERAEMKDNKGNRVFNAANIAIYLYSTAFLKEIGERMKSYTYYHVAKKPIPTIGGNVNGVKLEGFIFDLFEYANTFRILSVDRADEFSGIKNADDEGHTKADTPYTAVRDLHAMHWRWVKKADETLKVKGLSDIIVPDMGAVELSPLVSYAGEGLTVEILGKIVETAAGGNAGITSIECKNSSNL